MPVIQSVMRLSVLARGRLGSATLCGAVALVLPLSAIAQQATAQTTGAAQQPSKPAQPDAPWVVAPNAAQDAGQGTARDAAQQSAAATGTEQATPVAPANAPGSAGQDSAGQDVTAAAKPAITGPMPGEISEDELKKLLLGKQLYLRNGYLDNSLSFNEHGALIGHSPQGSFTLSGMEIDKVRLTKHKVELEGTRYGLHFLGALSYDDPANAVDRVRITPKKKVVKITIDREQVLARKKKKESANGKDQSLLPGVPAQIAAAPAMAAQTASEAPAEAKEPSETDQVKAEIAAAPAAERPADPGSVTATFSPAHARSVLRDALDRIFASGIDDRLIASMPDFWKLYYQALAANANYRPTDLTVLRQNAVDTKARLLTTFQPESNEYAQANAVSGMALYHAVIGPDGKPAEIAVSRPIGFGLDENAVKAIRNAAFQPAIKDGKPVSVLLDLVVEFHIYSKRTAVLGNPAVSNPEELSKSAQPSLPGPYSLLPP